MKELALHILDIAENGISAGAALIRISVEEEPGKDRLCIAIEDDGAGIPAEHLDQITDPFFTTRTTRRVGLGLSLFQAAARRCGGMMSVDSEVGCGTCVRAVFPYEHIDRAPLGDMSKTMVALVAGNPDVHFLYAHCKDADAFTLDTRELRKEAGEGPLAMSRIVRILQQRMTAFLDRRDSAGSGRERMGEDRDAETDR